MLKSNKFTIHHSQCDVSYMIDGFKMKNQDKVNQEITDIYNKQFENTNRDQIQNTLLKKFVGEIEELVLELGSSTNHFIRCIKPN